jgi:hypothetical protein
MLVAGLAGNHAFELHESIGSYVWVPIFRDNYRGSGVRHKQVAEAVLDRDFAYCPVYFGGDIDQRQAMRSFDFEFDHELELMRLDLSIPPPHRECQLQTGHRLRASRLVSCPTIILNGAASWISSDESPAHVIPARVAAAREESRSCVPGKRTQLPSRLPFPKMGEHKL